MPSRMPAWLGCPPSPGNFLLFQLLPAYFNSKHRRVDCTVHNPGTNESGCTTVASKPTICCCLSTRRLTNLRLPHCRRITAAGIEAMGPAVARLRKLKVRGGTLFETRQARAQLGLVNCASELLVQLWTMKPRRRAASLSSGQMPNVAHRSRTQQRAVIQVASGGTLPEVLRPQINGTSASGLLSTAFCSSLTKLILGPADAGDINWRLGAGTPAFQVWMTSATIGSTAMA